MCRNWRLILPPPLQPWGMLLPGLFPPGSSSSVATDRLQGAALLSSHCCGRALGSLRLDLFIHCILSLTQEELGGISSLWTQGWWGPMSFRELVFGDESGSRKSGRRPCVFSTSCLLSATPWSRSAHCSVLGLSGGPASLVHQPSFYSSLVHLSTVPVPGIS